MDGVMVDALERFRGDAGLALARGALEDMRRLGAPTCPANYEIWITHLSGANPGLSSEINARIGRGEAFTDAVNKQLHERYCAGPALSQEVMDASASITRELTEVVANLRGAGAIAGSFATELQAVASRIERGSDPAVLRTLVTGLASATRSMAEHNQRLEARIEASTRQMEALQTTLQDARVEALTDGLTGLANRKHFDNALRERVNESNAAQTDVCLILCDIDHFKRFNDTWGHQVGDQVIRYVSGVLRANATGDMLAARYGGEEFALLMPRATLRLAEALAERIRATVRDKNLQRRSTGEQLGRVTISLGVARYLRGEESAEWVARADACLYASKNAGRDRVTAETALPAATAA